MEAGEGGMGRGLSLTVAAITDSIQAAANINNFVTTCLCLPRFAGAK